MVDSASGVLKQRSAPKTVGQCAGNAKHAPFSVRDILSEYDDSWIALHLFVEGMVESVHHDNRFFRGSSHRMRRGSYGFKDIFGGGRSARERDLIGSDCGLFDRRRWRSRRVSSSSDVNSFLSKNHFSKRAIGSRLFSSSMMSLRLCIFSGRRCCCGRRCGELSRPRGSGHCLARFGDGFFKRGSCFHVIAAIDLENRQSFVAAGHFRRSFRRPSAPRREPKSPSRCLE